jgi:4-hydroxy-3-polyprenylbenzoate decarboxylase
VQQSEHDIAGGLLGEPIPLVRCETSDLLVPATAELVIEGEIPTDGWELDGASGEYTGYTILDYWVWPFHVKAITHRHNPIWHDFISQMPPSESSTISGIAYEARVANLLKRQHSITEVKDVAFHDAGGAHYLCVIRLQDASGGRISPSTVTSALEAALTVAPNWPAICIAVDADIDPWDLESVFWAVSFRCHPRRDVRLLAERPRTAGRAGEVGSASDEPPRPEDLTGPQDGSAMLMDATLKHAYSPVSLPKKPYMERAMDIWNELGLPPLKPRQPWFGYELGHWPDVYRRQADLAERGDFSGVAAELTGRRWTGAD